jgi:hypothetical protein
MAGQEQGRSDSGFVYEKTENGNEEIKTRKFNLSQKLRTLLIIVDGKKERGAILNQFSSMEGAAAALDELEQKGFIARKTANVAAPGALSSEEEQRRAKLAKAFMINTVTDAVGAMASSLLETLKKCETLQELRTHLDDYFYAITRGRGKAAAEEYREELEKYFPR